ncbi:MAG: NAD(P)-dependent oxidoreductase [Longimicrobiales bacterium]
MNRKLNSSYGIYVAYPLIVLAAILNSCVPDDGEIPSADLTERTSFSVEDYAQLTPDEFVDKFSLRESELPVREMPGWSPLQKVVVEMPGNEPWEGRFERLDFLQSVAPEVEFVPVKNLTDAISRGVLDDAQATIGLGCGPATIEAIGSQIHWIQSGSVGLDRCFNTVGEDAQRMQEKMKEQNVLVSSIRDMTKHSIAQHSLTIMLSLIGGMDIHAERQRKHIWGRTRTDVVRDKHLDAEFQDLTLFVVGLGSIGTELAKLANALGMRVIATRNSSRSGPDFVDYVGLSDEMYELAKEADIVFAAVPPTPATLGLFDMRFFDAMKESAYFLSIARLGVINWDDLKEALKSEKIAGFGTDDLPQDDFELWDLPRVIMTPHVSDYSPRYRDNQYVFYRENLRRYMAGEPLLNLIDVNRGY